jgi:hypothetical protein
MVSGILFTLHITGFAVAGPVLEQEKPRAGVDVHIPEDATTGLGKRGSKLEDLFKVVNKYVKPEDSSAARPSPSSPAGPGSLTESLYEPMDWEGPSIGSDHEMVDAPTESDLEMVDAPRRGSGPRRGSDRKMVDVTDVSPPKKSKNPDLQPGSSSKSKGQKKNSGSKKG